MRKRPPFALGRLVTLSVVLLGLSVSAAKPELVKDIDAGASTQGLMPEWKVAVGNQVFMMGRDEAHGRELWVSDGTDAGTRLVKDIFPGKASQETTKLVPVGKRVFFQADDGVHGKELWVSDGTEAGTRMVVDLVGAPGKGGVTVLDTVKNGVMFVADSDAHPTALWFSDGTAKGTTLIKVLDPEVRDAAAEYVNASWRSAGGLFYFFLMDPNQEAVSLWVSNGTAAGTKQTKTMLGGSYEDRTSGLWLLGTVGKTMYFRGADAEGRSYLWKSEGTTASTVMLKALLPESSEYQLGNFVSDGKRAYLLAQNQFTGLLEIWITDGTSEGTRCLNDYGEIPSFQFIVGLALRSGSLDIGYQDDDASGLWTVDLKTFESRSLWSTSGEGEYVQEIVSLGKRSVFISAKSESYRLGVTDGTPEGTQFIQEFQDYYGNSLENFMLAVAGRAYISAFRDTLVNADLWITDGTEAGTQRVNPAQEAMTGSSSPQRLRTIDGRIYFSATTPGQGRELWMTDGTEAGTVQIADIRPGSGGSSPADFTELDGLVYFSADDGVHGRELWCTDGTEAGTHLVKDLIEGSYGSEPEELITFGEHVYFRAKLSTSHGWELWRTDGTEEGTEAYAVLIQNPANSLAAYPRRFAVADGWLYFIAVADVAGGRSALFRTQGAEGSISVVGDGGTVSRVGTAAVVTDLAMRPAFVGPPYPLTLLPGQDIIYFVTEDGIGEHSLCYTTAYQAPTVISTQTGGLDRLDVSGIFVIWFNAYYGTGIWRSNGTPEGTRMVRHHSTGSRYSGAAGERVFYSTWDSDRGITELHSIRVEGHSDVLLSEKLGLFTYTPLHVEEETLFFSETRANEGATLMRSNGTRESTWALAGLGEREPDMQWGEDVKTAPVTNFQKLGESLYFGAKGPVGTELYTLPLTPGLELAVVMPSGPSTLSPGEPVDFGAEGLNLTRNASIQIRNVGVKTLYGLSITRSSLTPEDFTILPYDDVSPITPGASLTVELAFTPAAVGLREGSIEIAGLNVNAEVLIQGRGLANNAAPVIGGLGGRRPTSHLAWEGEPFMLEPPPVGSPGDLALSVWMKDGKQVGDEPYLEFGSAELRHGGTYTYYAVNGQGYAESLPGYVAVVRALEPQVTAQLGRSVTLTCQVGGPASRLRYQWLRDGLPLASFGRIQGAQSARLTISDLQAEDGVPFYECIVTLEAPEGPQSMRQGITQIVIEEGPQVVSSAIDLVTYISEPVEYALELNVEGRVRVTGLPPGLRADDTGYITGTPTKALPVDPVTGRPGAYRVTATVRDAETKRTSLPMTFNWTILPPLQAGYYEGNLPRDMESADSLDRSGRIQLTITRKNSVSGNLRYQGKNFRFTSQGGTAYEGTSVSITIRRPRLEPLQLEVYYNPDTKNCEIGLEDYELETGVNFVARSPAFTAEAPDARYEGIHNVAFEPDESEAGETAPRGTGFLSFTVSRSAQINWAGRMADDTVITGSGILGRADAYADETAPRLEIHAEPYREGGAVHGYAEGSFETELPPARWSGVMTWNKPAMKNPGQNRAYREGFPLQSLTVSGSQYIPPVGGNLVIGIEEIAGPADNGVFTLRDPLTLEPDLSGNFHLLTNNRVRLLGDGLSAPLESLTIDAKKGLFSGTVKLEDENPDNPSKPFLRKAKFQGVLLNLQQEGVGYCLLPELPDEEGETLSNTPLQSFMTALEPLR